MINTNWPRWVWSSITTHFKTMSSNRIHMYVEGDVRDTENFQNYFELRLNGPHINEVNRNTYHVDCVINALVCSTKNDQNIYTLDDNLGFVLASFTDCIAVMQHRDTTDPVIQEGTLVIQPPIETFRFGQVKNDIRLMQAQIEASYRMLIEN